MAPQLRRVLVAFVSGSLLVSGAGLLLLYLFICRFYDRLSSGQFSLGMLAVFCASPLLTIAAGVWLAMLAIRSEDVRWSRRKILGAMLLIAPMLAFDLLPMAAILLGVAGADLTIDMHAQGLTPVTICGVSFLLCMIAGLVLVVDRDLTQL